MRKTKIDDDNIPLHIIQRHLKIKMHTKNTIQVANTLLEKKKRRDMVFVNGYLSENINSNRTITIDEFKNTIRLF